MIKFKDIEVGKLNKMAELAKEQGKEAMAKQYERMAIWHKNAKKMHYPHFFKLILLRSLINHAFVNAIGISILLEMLGDKGQNLLNTEFKIDKDFIRAAEPNIYWKELLRNTFIAFTRNNPIPALAEWKETGHPFLEKYKGDNDTLNFNDVFRNHCDFYDSHNHFEVQIADIVGIIINRHHNRDRAHDAYNALWKKIKKQHFTKIILNDNPDESINPEIID